LIDDIDCTRSKWAVSEAESDRVNPAPIGVEANLEMLAARANRTNVEWYCTIGN
jgi:hypothetical protein